MPPSNPESGIKIPGFEFDSVDTPPIGHRNALLQHLPGDPPAPIGGEHAHAEVAAMRDQGALGSIDLHPTDNLPSILRHQVNGAVRRARREIARQLLSRRGFVEGQEVGIACDHVDAIAQARDIREACWSNLN